MLVKARFQGQLPGLVSLRDSVRHFDVAGLQIVTCDRGGIDGLECVSTTRVTLSNPSASVSKNDMVGEVCGCECGLHSTGAIVNPTCDSPAGAYDGNPG